MIPPARVPMGGGYDLGEQLKNAATQMIYFQNGKPVPFYENKKVVSAGQALANVQSDAVLQVILHDLMKGKGLPGDHVNDVENYKLDLATRIQTHENLGREEHDDLIKLCEQLGGSLTHMWSHEPEQHPFKHY